MVVNREHLQGMAHFKGTACLVDDAIHCRTALFVGQVFRTNLGATSCVNEVVKADARNTFVTHQLENGGDFAHIGTGKGDAEAHLHTSFAAIADGVERTCIGARDATEGVMRGLYTVNANAHIANTDFSNALCNLRGNAGAVGREDHAQPLLTSNGGEFENVFANEGFATREEQHGTPEGGKAINGAQRLFVRQLLRDIGFTCGVAMATLEIATLGDVPNDNRLLVLGKL